MHSKNKLLFFIKSKINITIVGKNIERFIKRLRDNNIEIINIKYISNDEINIIIYKKDYDKVIKLKTIYDIEIVNYYGIEKVKNMVLNSKYILIFIIIGIVFMGIISNMIFSIDIITNDSKMKKTLLSELKDYGIDKYRFQKDYNEIQVIKEKILNKYKNEIEWIEIESIGTKYIVKYVPRINNNKTSNNSYRSIIAKKDCIIKNINVLKGQIVKEINTYVKKGEVIVSGYIDLNGSIKDTVSSSGSIYGEVWYKINITYPYKYKEEKETGNINNVLVFKLFNNDIELFNFNKYKTKKKENKTIIKSNILPIKLLIQKQRETILINENNNEKDVIDKALKLSKNKIKKNLKEGEYISNYKILNMIKNEDSITLNIFFSVVEDVTEYMNIEKYEENIE